MIPFLIYFQSAVTFPLVALDKISMKIYFTPSLYLLDKVLELIIGNARFSRKLTFIN